MYNWRLYHYCQLIWSILFVLCYYLFRALTLSSKEGYEVYIRHCHIVAEHHRLMHLEKLTRHLMLYAKGHYRRSGSTTEDLRIMFSHYSGVDKTMYSDMFIFDIVKEAFVESCSRQDINDVMKCFYRKPYGQGIGAATLEEMVSHMLGLMGCIQVYDGQNTLVELGEADPKYLPVTERDPA